MTRARAAPAALPRGHGLARAPGVRVALILIVVIHGLIHLMGSVKEWNLAAVPGMTGATLFTIPASLSRVVGALWLAACLSFLAAAVMLVVRHDAFWIAGAAGVALSQALVIYAWPDAKAGTLVNLVIAVAVVHAFADVRFQRGTDDAVRSLFAKQGAAAPTIVEPRELDGLPAPVRRWLEASGVVGKERVHSVRLKQRGFLRTSPDGEWMPAEAHQYFSVDEPGFVWRAQVRMMRVIPIAGRDSYLGGKGRMLIAAASLLPVVDAADEKIDQGTLLRFLGEIVWFPGAALRPYVRWEEVDATSAKATISYRGVTASGVFTFDDQGRMVSMSADRYRATGATATLDRWFIPASAWRAMNGVMMPVKGEVIWKLKEGDFSYYRWEITQVEHNRPELYAE